MDIGGKLYEKYAHLIIEEENLDIRGVVKKITDALQNNE